MTIIAEHLNRVKASEVSIISARALELERQGKSVVRLSAGEPDFPTPDHIKMACIKALCDNKTKYPPVIGLPELREADLQPAGAGVRAQAIDPAGALVDDFSIQALGGLVHVLNAPSPAATSALPIADHIVDVLGVV